MRDDLSVLVIDPLRLDHHGGGLFISAVASQLVDLDRRWELSGIMTLDNPLASRCRPQASSEAVARRMSTFPRRDTEPEIRLRRELHRRGLRYRVDAPIPGIPRRRSDILFSRTKIVIFVDGCYWHGCPNHFRPAGRNREWWQKKILENQARDRDTQEWLESQGWLVLRFWEHDDPSIAANQVESTVRGRGVAVKRRAD